MSQRTNPVKFSAAALATCLVLSACGGGDAEAPPTAVVSAPVVTPPVVTPPVVTPPVVTPPVVTPPVVTPPTVSGSLLTSFDETTAPTVTEFGGAGYAIEAGPTGGTGKALRITRPGGEVFAGAFVATTIPFTATRKAITARVYSPTAGTPMIVKAEYAENTGTSDTAPTTAVVVGWQTLTWVFNDVDLTKAYTRFTILPNLGAVGTGQSYFFDDIALAPEGAVVVPPVVAGDLVLASFDETTPPTISEFGGAGYAIEAAPAGGSGNALRITRPGGAVFAGAFVATAPMPFSATRKTITARVYSPTAGIPMPVKAEYAENAGTGDTLPTTAVVVGWQTLTWVFNNLDLTKSYTRFTLLPNLGTVGTGQSYFFDDIKLLAATAPPPAAVAVTIATLDEPTAALVGFEGCWDSTVAVDPAGGTNKVGKVVKPGSGVPFYCGSTVVTVPNGGLQPVAFTGTAQTVTVRVWSPDAGIPVRLKLEDIADGAKSVETEATTTAVGWQTLTFDFGNAVSGTPVLNLTTTYNKASIFFNFGVVGTGKTYYFDDITFVTGTGTNTVLATFDEKNYDNSQSQPSTLTGFGGAENSVVIGYADGGVPADGSKSGKLAKVVKNAGETYAGTSVQRKANDAVPTIPFATGATKMTVRVYSAYVGVRVHLKVEQSGRPDWNSEVDAFTTVANTWETLTFDFGPAGKHFVPSGPGPNGYVTDPAAGSAYKPTSQLDVTKTFNKINIFFDYGLGDAGYDAMPGTRTYYFDDLKFTP
jgi:uncharacterized protein YkuJ